MLANHGDQYIQKLYTPFPKDPTNDHEPLAQVKM